MPKTAAKHESSPSLVALVDAMGVNDAFRRAENAFSLSGRMGEGGMPDAELLQRLKPVLDKAQLKVVASYLEARAAAGAVMRDVATQHHNEVKVATKKVLTEFAKPLGNDFFEFRDRYVGAVRAQVKGFDSCYRATNGSICGSVRVSKRGDGSSEPWVFGMQDGRMVVHSEPIDY